MDDIYTIQKIEDNPDKKARIKFLRQRSEKIRGRIARAASNAYELADTLNNLASLMEKNMQANEVPKDPTHTLTNAIRKIQQTHLTEGLITLIPYLSERSFEAGALEESEKNETK